MITLYNFKEIEQIKTVSNTYKEELKKYFQEIAQGIVGEKWESYSLDEVGPILVIEDTDTIDVLDEYGIMQGSETIPMSIPEFALRVTVDGIEILKIIWICNDSFGISVYCPVGKFGKEFDEYISEFIMD